MRAAGIRPGYENRPCCVASRRLRFLVELVGDDVVFHDVTAGDRVEGAAARRLKDRGEP